MFVWKSERRKISGQASSTTAINEQVEATNDLGHTTISMHDNLGGRTTRIHPDAGETNYFYDLAGNLIELQTANLTEEGLSIDYVYDHERLVEIHYPWLG